MRTPIRMLTTLLILSSLVQSAPAAALWQDDFNMDTSGQYDVLDFTFGRDGALFAFDYGALGIPEAPHSDGGATTGVKMFVNDPFEDTTNSTSAIQIVPIGLDAVLPQLDYTITYDVWMNVNGPLPEGGGGSTEAMMVGVGFSAEVPIEAGNTDGTYFTLTGEAGVRTDVRSFTNDGFNGLNEDGDPINVASVNLDDPYYAGIFPGGVDVGALPVQGGQDNQIGVTRSGQMAFQWHQVRVDVRDESVEFFVDDLLIARDKNADIDGNMFIGLADYFSSESDVPKWHFSVIDNLLVVTPERGDFDRNGLLDAADIDLLSAEVRAGNNRPEFDLDGDGNVDEADRTVWVNELRSTYFGDANLDGEFNTADFLAVFQAGEYEDAIDGNSSWATGDWNGDSEFESGDFVTAFRSGGFEKGPRQAVGAVPEPSGPLTLLNMLVALGGFPRYSSRRHGTLRP